MVKCWTHGLRGFNGAVQRRLATPTVTMLISSCWQVSSEVELRRIFDVCKRWANSGSHEFVKKNMVRYMRPHGQFAHRSCKNAFLHLPCANRPFWPLVSKYTISWPCMEYMIWDYALWDGHEPVRNVNFSPSVHAQPEYIVSACRHGSWYQCIEQANPAKHKNSKWSITFNGNTYEWAKRISSHSWT